MNRQQKALLSSILQIFRTLHRLKELPRQGYIYFGFKGDETDSIAEHSFMVAWIAYVLAQQLKDKRALGIDDQFIYRVTKIALVHDWSEAVLGDLGYIVKSAMLSAAEEQAFDAIIQALPEKEIEFREELVNTWNAYEQEGSLEAAIVKFADALDGWLQGLATPTAWWPAWEDSNRQTEATLKTWEQPELAKIFRRTSDLAKCLEVESLLPQKQSEILGDDDLRRLLQFIKNIYSLKELPRHGFTIFGMKRSETDTFAGHMFTTASLSYLLARSQRMTPKQQHEAIMMALIHDLPVVITGDVSYDLQVSDKAKGAWMDAQKQSIERLTGYLDKSSREEVKSLWEEWSENDSRSKQAWIVHVATALDAWEMGVTTPTAWINAWMAYREQTKSSLHNNHVDQNIVEMLEQGYEELSRFEPVKENGYVIGRKPLVELIRLE